MTTIFVFGSNTAGVHGAGAALTAVRQYGAIRGVGEGRTGNAYAIPTRMYHNGRLITLPLQVIAQHVETFKRYASHFPDLTFYVTKIGTGLAGYSAEQIAPMFSDCPPNCRLPKGWA